MLPATVDALDDVGITHPFPIQEMTLPVALHGHDIIGQAKTGTGKTLGFGIPLLQRVVAPDEEGDPTLPPIQRRQAAGAGRRPDPRAVRAGHRRPGEGRGPPQRPRPGDLRRPRVRAAGRGAQEGRRRRRRHAGPAARPGPAGPARPRPRPQPGARRGRRDARPGLPARRREDRAADPRRPADDAVLGDHAGRGHRAGPPLHAPADAHPRRRPRRRRPDRRRPSSSTSSGRTPWTRSRCSRASCRPTAAA